MWVLISHREKSWKKFRPLWTPYVSHELLKVETSNSVHIKKARAPNHKYAKICHRRSGVK